MDSSYICGSNNSNHEFAENRYQSRYDLRDAVKLPPQEDPNEWIAHNLYSFHKQIDMLYGTISEECTPDRCPTMTTGRRYKYVLSVDPKEVPCERSAPEYIELILDWVQEQLNNDDIFPSMSVEKYNDWKEFPPNFIEICQTISRRLIRIFAHIYHHHSQLMKYLKIEAHMITSMKHFIYFVKEFSLVTDEDLESLKNYVEKLNHINENIRM